MTLSTVTPFSGFTDKAPLSPSYFNSKLSEVYGNLTALNAAASVSATTAASSVSSLGWYDARSYGTTINSTAILAAISAASAAGGGVVYLGPGNWNITSPVTVDASYIKIRGAGPQFTQFTYNPVSSAPCVVFDGAGSSLWNCELSGVFMASTNTTFMKTMVKLVDVRHFFLDELTSSSGLWSGQSSIGMWIQGREFINARRCQIYADRPQVIDLNPNLATNALDMSIFENMQLVVDSGLTVYSNISIQNGCAVTRTRWRELDAARGNGIVHFNNAATVQASSELIFDAVSGEQMSGASDAFAFNFSSTSGEIQHLTFRNCLLPSEVKGFNFRTCVFPSIVNCQHTGGSGVTALSVNTTVEGLYVSNFQHSPGAIISGLTSSIGYHVVNMGPSGSANAAVPWFSQVRVGHTGTLIPAISSMSSKIAAFVVQGSASSFTVVTWVAAQAGDAIQVTIQPDAAVSSLSSGLVLHSHCTQNGQVEFRLSNCSTLVQNQSSKTYYFLRVSPF